MLFRIIVVNEAEIFRELSEDTFIRSSGCEILRVANSVEALSLLPRKSVAALVADFKSLGMGLREFLKKVEQQSLQTEVFLLTNPANSLEVSLDGKLVLCHFLDLPFDIRQFTLALRNLFPQANSKPAGEPLTWQTSPRAQCGYLVGGAPCMQELFEMIGKVSHSDLPVLIMGETGTGKELVARAIHQISPRRDKPFLPVDCGGLVPTLIETELFGYMRGAFTGAIHNREGLLAAAEGGTVFLDEIGEMPVNLQAKLLRVLQEREFRPVGRTHAVKFDARIIAATNRDLKAAMEQGTFRQDLYFRLNVVTLQVPPLREHKQDIPLLVNHILEIFAPGPPRCPAVSDQALECLMAYDWPGNVRELENCIQRAVALGSSPILYRSDLPPSLLNRHWCAAQPLCGKSVLSLEELDRQAIMEAIAIASGDKSQAARMLGIGVSTLYRKLKKHAKSASNGSAAIAPPNSSYR